MEESLIEICHFAISNRDGVSRVYSVALERNTESIRVHADQNCTMVFSTTMDFNHAMLALRKDLEQP